MNNDKLQTRTIMEPPESAVKSVDTAIVWLPGVYTSRGGIDGPAGGLFKRLGHQFRHRVATLNISYSSPGELESCAKDTLGQMSELQSTGVRRFVLVGHSFGGAVAIGIGALTDAVIGVATLSAQTRGTNSIEKIAPRPLLLIHGTDDPILPASCSQDLYARASHGRQLILYEGARHWLSECQNELDQDLTRWLEIVLAT